MIEHEDALKHDTFAHIEAGGFGVRAPLCPACVAPVESVDELVEGEYDHRTRTNIVRVTENWITSWAPYGFNDRLMLTRRDAWPYFVAAGWCYNKGGVVILAAKAYDPETDWAPAGFKKTACDERACRVPVPYAEGHLHDCFCTAPYRHGGDQHTCDHDRELQP